MRTPLLIGLLALSLPACIVGGELTGVGGEEGTGEEEGGGGSGSGSGSGSGTTLTPRVTATLDKTSITTENGKTETVTVALTSEDGFAGDVTLTPTLVDASDVAIPNVTFEGPATVTLAADGTGTAAYTVKLPSNTTGAVLSASLKVGVMSSVGTQDLTSAVTINNFYTVDYAAGTGANQPNHKNAGAEISIKRGTIVKIVNSDTITHVVHAPNHENDAGGAPGRIYEVPTIGIAPGTRFAVGCHSHQMPTYGNYTLQ